MKKKKIVGKAVRVFLVLALAGCLVLFLVNLYIIRKEEKYIVSAEEAEAFQDVDCIMVLGCGVRPDGSPSGMLNDRLVQGVSLYKEDVSDRLLMSGDHGRVNYDEVNLMKQFAIDRGVPSENIFMDHAGFSTYDSVYRAKEIFCAKKVIIVSQKYHLPRALYVAEKLGLDAYGVAAADVSYRGQGYREAREMLARAKDFCNAALKRKPRLLGDAIPVSGNGDSTND